MLKIPRRKKSVRQLCSFNLDESLNCFVIPFNGRASKQNKSMVISVKYQAFWFEIFRLWCGTIKYGQKIRSKISWHSLYLLFVVGVSMRSQHSLRGCHLVFSAHWSSLCWECDSCALRFSFILSVIGSNLF